MWKYEETIEYLVSNERCRIPNINPYHSEIMKDFARLRYRPCVKYKPLTSVVYNVTKKLYTLTVIKEHTHFYSHWKPLNCSYQYIIRDIDSNIIDSIDTDYSVS